MKTFEKLSNQINAMGRSLKTIKEDLNSMSSQKTSLHEHAKQNEVDPVKQEKSNKNSTKNDGFQVVTRGQIKEAHQEKKFYTRRTIEPITTVRKNLKEIEEASKHPEKQFVIDKVNSLLRNWQI